MVEKTTSHIFWFFVTFILFCLGGPILAAIGVICWLAAAKRTKRYNAEVALQRHNEIVRAQGYR